MDLVSCRNVLIYLDSMHRHAFSKFHFALNPGGFLLLGKSETAVSSPELFAPLDKEARLYVRQESARHPALHSTVAEATGAPGPHRGEALRRPAHRIDLRRQADRVWPQRYGPPQSDRQRQLWRPSFPRRDHRSLSGQTVRGPGFLEEIKQQAPMP